MLALLANSNARKVIQRALSDVSYVRQSKGKLREILLSAFVQGFHAANCESILVPTSCYRTDWKSVWYRLFNARTIHSCVYCAVRMDQVRFRSWKYRIHLASSTVFAFSRMVTHNTVMDQAAYLAGTMPGMAVRRCRIQDLLAPVIDAKVAVLLLTTYRLPTD